MLTDVSSVMRSRSLSRISVRSAASTSLCISAEIACSVLNRKCGWSCCCSVASRASTSCVSSCDARSGAVARLAVVEDGVTEPDDRPVGHHLPVEVGERRLLEPAAPSRIVPPADNASHHCTARDHGDVTDGEEGRSRQMNEHRAHEHRPLEPEMLRQPDDRGREKRPARTSRCS